MSSGSVCQVARSWVNVGSFHTRLFGVVYVTCGYFHGGSEKGTASVRRKLAVARLKHVEHFTERNKLCTVASC
jgi:hypothetical protein